MPQVEHFIVWVLSVSVWVLCSGGFPNNGMSQTAEPAKMSSVLGKNTSRPGSKQEYPLNVAEVFQNLFIGANRLTSLRASEGQLDNINSNVTDSDTAVLHSSPNRTNETIRFPEISRILLDPLHFHGNSGNKVDETQKDILAYFRAVGNIVPKVSADGASVLENEPTAEKEANRANTDSLTLQDTYPGMLAAGNAKKLMQVGDKNKSNINSFMRLGGKRNTNYLLSGQHVNISQFMRQVTLLRESLKKFVGHKRVLRSLETKSSDMETGQNATELEFVYENRLVGSKLTDNTETSTVGGMIDTETSTVGGMKDTETSPVGGMIDTVGGATSDDKRPTAGSHVSVNSWRNMTVAKQDGDGLSGSNYTSISETPMTVSMETTLGDVLVENITDITVTSGPDKIIEPDTQSRNNTTHETASARSLNFLNIVSPLSSSSVSTSPVSRILMSNGDDTIGATFPTATTSYAAESSEIPFTSSQFKESDRYSRMPTSLSSDKFNSEIHKSEAELWTNAFTVTSSSIVDHISIETTSTGTTQIKTSTVAVHSSEVSDGIDLINGVTKRQEITNAETSNSLEITDNPEITNNSEKTNRPEIVTSPDGTNGPQPESSVFNSLDRTTTIKQETSSVQPDDRPTDATSTRSLGKSFVVSESSVNMDSLTTAINNADVSQRFRNDYLDAYSGTTIYSNAASHKSSYDTVDTYSLSTETLNSTNHKSSYDTVDRHGLSTETLNSESQKHSDGYTDSNTTPALSPDASQKSTHDVDRKIATDKLIISQTSDHSILGDIVSTAPVMLGTEATSDNYSDIKNDIVTSPLTDSGVSRQSHRDYMDTSSSSTRDDQKFDNDYIDTSAVSSISDNSTSGLVPTHRPGLEHSPTTPNDRGVYMNSSSKNVAVYSTLPAAVAELDWEAAKQIWAYAWEIHIYVFGGLFGLFGLYTLLSLVRCWWIRCLLSTGCIIWLHILLIAVCSTRSFYLLYDGYGSSGAFHVSLDHFLYSMPFPCLTAAFSSLFYWLLQTTQVQLMPSFVQRVQVLVVVITVHFMISLTTDVLVGVFPDTHILLFVCHTYSITWSLFLFFGYTIVFRKLHTNAIKHQKDESYNPPMTPSFGVEKTSSLTLNPAVKAMLCVALCGLVVTGLEIYAIVEVYKIFTPGFPTPWTWWSYHTALRTFEICMCLLLVYIISLPRRYRISGTSCSGGVLCAPCSEIFCCRQSINKSKRGSFFKHFHKTPAMNSFHNRYKESFTENSSKELLDNQLTDQIHPVQPIFGSRPNSLLIIEDGYVRFQTEYDINKIVDSCNDLSQRPVEDHSMGTFLGKDGVLNTGYTLNPGEDSQTRNNSESRAFLTGKSRNSSATNSDYFRVPSSVSLADSIENELEKAFRSFKMDASADEEENNKPSDMYVVSDVQIAKSTDAVSFVSVNNSKATIDNQELQPFQQDLDQDPVIQSKSHYPILTNQNQLLTFPSLSELTESTSTTKGTVSVSEPKIPVKPRNERSPSGLINSSDTVHLHLLDVSQKHHQADSSEDSDYDSECNFPVSGRRPSEGQGCQAAVLTSLLTSWETESGENIDV